MLKQITVKNIYNFKNELTIDFINDGSEGINKKYNNDYISNFTLLYGKNNVGKSNLFKLINEVKTFVLNNHLQFKAYRPEVNSDSSLFEVIIQNNINEVRYGFEIYLKSGIIVDEWLYSKSNNEDVESLVFSRLESEFSNKITESDKKVLLSILDDVLYISHFNNLNHNYLEIISVIDFFKSIQLIQCDRLNSKSFKDDLNILHKISENQALIKILNAFLSSADLDISKVKLSKLSSEESSLIESLKAINTSSLAFDEKNRKIEALINNNISLVSNLLIKEVLGQEFSNGNNDNVYLQFIHKSNALFNYEDLSSGTKKILSIALAIINSINTSNILLFDELENNLHIELINLTLSFLKTIISRSDEIQVILSTHREDLLDYDFISNQNKMFLKVNPKTFDISIDYLSQFKLKEHQQASRRYALDAFETNPNTSYEYKLNVLLESLYSDNNG